MINLVINLIKYVKRKLVFEFFCYQICLKTIQSSMKC